MAVHSFFAMHPRLVIRKVLVDFWGIYEAFIAYTHRVCAV